MILAVERCTRSGEFFGQAAVQDYAEALGYELLGDAEADACAAACNKSVGGGVGEFVFLEGGGRGEEVEGQELVTACRKRSTAIAARAARARRSGYSMVCTAG